VNVSELASGGAPLLGEPPAIELANTAYAVRGRPQEGLAGREELAAWLRDVRPRLATRLTDQDLLGADEHDLRAARALRDAVRALAAAAVHRTPPPHGAVDTVNEAARAAPHWRALTWGGDDPGTEAPSATAHSAGRPVAAALAELAESAISLFTGPGLAALRACQGPRCVLFYVKNHPRRTWCSPACGNRARAARHQRRDRPRTVSENSGTGDTGRTADEVAQGAAAIPVDN
jgi:predicted RNA-binding Zn ribbon-like protein